MRYVDGSGSKGDQKSPDGKEERRKGGFYCHLDRLFLGLLKVVLCYRTGF